MTEDEQRLAIEEAAMIIADGDPALGHDEAREILAPMFAKIAALEAENAALRKRLVVDDAMVGRARNAHYAVSLSDSGNGPMRAALTAALANKDETK